MGSSNIKDLINKMVDKGNCTFRIGTVTAVDKNTDTCTVQMKNNEADRLNVQLKAIIDNNSTGYILYPKQNTDVLVGIIDGVVTHSFIAMVAELDSMKLVIGSNKLIADANTYNPTWQLWQFNDGSNAGLVNIKPLINKLNNLEKDLNKIKGMYSTLANNAANILTASPGAPDAGIAALIAATSQWFGSLFTPTTQSDLEDTKVKH